MQIRITSSRSIPTSLASSSGVRWLGNWGPFPSVFWLVGRYTPPQALLTMNGVGLTTVSIDCPIISLPGVFVNAADYLCTIIRLLELFEGRLSGLDLVVRSLNHPLRVIIVLLQMTQLGGFRAATKDRFFVAFA